MTFEDWLATCETALTVQTREILRQSQAGAHRSRQLGPGWRLRHHEAYRPGDSRRAIDWKASRKSDTLLVRRFEADQRLDVLVVCDVSASMLFGRHRTKLSLALDCAGILGLATLKQGNAFGLTLFDTEVVAHFPPRQRRSMILEALDYLWHYTPSVHRGTATQLAPVLQHIPMHRPHLICLVSDFRMAAWQPLLSQLNPAHDTIAIWIEDEAETIVPHLRSQVTTRDLESGNLITVDMASTASRRRLQTQLEADRNAREQALQLSCGPNMIQLTSTLNTAGDIVGELLFKLFLARSTPAHM